MKFTNKPGGRLTNRLESSQLTGWQTSKQTVAVVKSTVYQRVSSSISDGASDEAHR